MQESRLLAVLSPRSTVRVNVEESTYARTHTQCLHPGPPGNVTYSGPRVFSSIWEVSTFAERRSVPYFVTSAIQPGALFSDLPSVLVSGIVYSIEPLPG